MGKFDRIYFSFVLGMAIYGGFYRALERMFNTPNPVLPLVIIALWIHIVYKNLGE